MRARKTLGRDVAVIGGAMSHFGAFPEKSSCELIAEAFAETLTSVDRSFDRNDIEAVYLGNFCSELFEGQSHLGQLAADWLNLAPCPVSRIEGACASSGLAFREGVFSIASGMYDIVLVCGVEKMTCLSTNDTQGVLSKAGDFRMESEQASLTFPGIFAAMASAYFAKYGASREQLMRVSKKNHDNGALNSKAHHNVTLGEIIERRKAKRLERGLPPPNWTDEYDFLRDEQQNPPVASPLHLFDCSPISDGAACVILAAEEIARHFTDDVIRVRATSQSSAGPTAVWNSDLTSLPAVKHAAKQAYAMAGVNASDIDFAEVHDCFTPAEVFAVEDLGFFQPGHGAFALADFQTSRDSDRPINASGGLKAKGHPVGATGVAQLQEVWQQLRGIAGAHQLKHKNLRLGLTHNVGGAGGTCVVHILERL